MIKSKIYIKWAVYILILLLVYILQMTPSLFPRFFSASPILIIPAAVMLSMHVGETEAAVIGLIGGFLWDVGGMFILGFNALILMVSCCAVSLLISFLMRNNILTALLLGSGVLYLQYMLWWFFFKVIWRNPQAFHILFYKALPTIIYSAVFIIPFYYGAKFLVGKLQEVQ